MDVQLRRLNPWWDGPYRSGAIERPQYLKEMEKSEDLVTFLVGLRRIGKTTLMRLFIEKLQKKVNSERILYVPLDHPLFLDKTIYDIVETFRKMNRIKFSEKIYLFFDEIQSKENFESELKSLIDNENAVIFCSGSQSLLLKDRSAKLTGRTKKIEVKPLSFPEYLRFRSIEIGKADSHMYESYFSDYMEYGGIPRYAMEMDQNYVIQLVDAIITKDIVSYHNIRNPKVLTELFLLLCERAGKKMSINKIARILSISVESARQYLSYMEECFLIHLVYRKARSLNERIKSNRKVYIADVGIRNAMTGFRDKGSVFENLVYLKIKDRNPFYYFENGKEVDFVFGSNGIECKYGKKEDLEYLKKLPFKVDVVSGHDFFLE